MKYLVYINSALITGFIQSNTGLGDKGTAHKYANKQVAKAHGSILAARLRQKHGQIKLDASYKIVPVKE